MIKLFFNSKLIKQAAFLVLSFSLLFIGLKIVGAEKVWSSFNQFPFWVVAGILVAFILNLAVVSFRLKQLLQHSGKTVPYSIALKANLHGNFASLFVISLVGQVVGRQMFLSRYIDSPILLASLTAVERIILFVISSFFCLLGAIWIISSKDLSIFLGELSLFKIVIVIIISITASLRFRMSSFERRLLVRMVARENLKFFLKLIGITFFAQALVLGAFVIGVEAFNPDIFWVDILAAAAITSFAASLPISVNGWGLREMAAIFAFGYIGVSSSSAFAVSILVGICSTIVVLLAWPYVFFKNEKRVKLLVISQAVKNSLSTEKVVTWFLVALTTMFIFFQIQLPVLRGGYINVNISDVLVMLLLTSNLFYVINSRQLPRWDIPKFNLILLIISALILFAFLNGVLKIGITQWALFAKMFGWLVLVGYLSVGLLTVSFFGRVGLLRLIDILITTAVVIVLFNIVIRSIPSLIHIAPISLTANFEGFSGNRNAFAFQLLVCSALLMANSRIGKVKRVNSVKKDFVPTAAHGVILAGIALTASKAGILTAAIVLIGSSLIGIVNRRMVFRSFIFGFLIWITFVWFLPFAGNFFNVDSSVQVQSTFSNPVSTVEHWDTNFQGIKMWSDSPWFGSGLGVFIEMSPQWFNKPMIIHSTPIWILAEFGLFGGTVLLAVLTWIVFHATKTCYAKPRSRAVILLIATFLIFCLVHEIFYQRIFWMVLGICIALPYHKSPKKYFSQQLNKL